MAVWLEDIWRSSGAVGSSTILVLSVTPSLHLGGQVSLCHCASRTQEQECKSKIATVGAQDCVMIVMDGGWRRKSRQEREMEVFCA